MSFEDKPAQPIATIDSDLPLGPFIMPEVDGPNITGRRLALQVQPGTASDRLPDANRRQLSLKSQLGRGYYGDRRSARG
jgi:hypothetical protein